ncbi:MAG: hypothetical protein PVJ80_00550 [Gemmatimonadota bacterium]
MAWVLFAATACTGVNIFPTGVAAGDDTGGAPTVDITEPAADAALTQGDSVRVSADVTSTTGLNQVTLSGSFMSGTSAFEQQVVSFSGATDTTVTRFLQPAGTQTGDARIVVQARDLLGNVGVDTVLVSVN